MSTLPSQLSHSLQMQFGEPIVEFYEIHLVSSGAQILSQLDDASDADAAESMALALLTISRSR